jgi:autoinducer 2-degrading protein
MQAIRREYGVSTEAQLAGPYVVLVTLRVQPDRRAEFLAAIRKNAIASVRDEAGCFRFDVHEDRLDPTHFILHEIYRDEDAFRVEHRAAPHYVEWREAAERCLVKDSQANTFLAPVPTS